MTDRIRLFVFGIENGLVLLFATLVVVALGLLGLGYFTTHGLTLPTSASLADSEGLIEHAVAVLNKSNIWSNVFFLAAQTCLVFVALHLTKFLYGRGRIIANVRKNVSMELQNTWAAVQAVLTDQEELRSAASINYLKELADENGRNRIRENLSKAIDACESLDSHCRGLADYLSKIEIHGNLLDIAAGSDACAEALADATGLWKRDSYVSALDKGRQHIAALEHLKLVIG